VTGSVPAPGVRSLFDGGGELGREMAARDWSQTSLGPPETWPAALRNAVRIVLTSRFSMWMAWGPELAFFYNDAYWRDTLQAKHPWALGRPAAEVWAEIWDDIAPRIHTVMDTGVATWDQDLQLFLQRNGYPEESYHTFSYSPLDDEGVTRGLLCVVAENTERVLGERRMATLRDLAAAVAAVRTADEVLAAVGDQLGAASADLPFGLVYLRGDDGTARLAAAAGVEPGSRAAPQTLGGGTGGTGGTGGAASAGNPDGTGGPDRPDGTGGGQGTAPAWPVVGGGDPALVEDLDRFGPLPTGAWEVPPTQALVVPIASATAGQTAPAGFLVAGLNPHRRLDDAYRGFVELVANQIASGLAGAASYEAERHRAETLAELDRAKTDFFSNVSHEFRTPLTLIMGPVQELRSSAAARSDRRVREELEVVHRNALRLGRLVNTLLDFSRLQAGRIEARFEPVDLAATTAELASVFRSALDRAGLALTVDCPPLGEPVHVDRDMWEKVVLNLLSNALKFTFEGGITVRLRRQDGREGGAGAAVLTVADTGTGIPAEELPTLFERFSRVRGARARSGEGSGIGLAMVRELVSLHGGTVEVASTPDVGTTFTVTLPLGTAHLPVDRLAPPAPDTAAVSSGAAPFVTEALRWLPGAEEPADLADDLPDDLPDGLSDDLDGDGGAVRSPGGAVRSPGGARAGRVLVADDNADMRGYLLRLLEPRYEVTAVADGQVALASALAEPPDLVVSDVMMPRLDGMQLLAALRADARTSRVPVLLLSARAGQEAAVEGLAAGADDYLVKPFSAQELLARVGAHLHLGRARREAEERFTAMADLAPALIWVADPSGRRGFVNRGWTAFTGRDSGAELGDGWQEGLHPEDRERYLATVAAAIADGRGWEVEFRLRRSDGAHHWLLERAVPVGAGETAAGWVGSCTDINARYRETERQTLLAAVGARMDRDTDVDRQLAGLARLLVDRRLADLCTVRLVEDDGSLRVVGAAALDPAHERLLAGMGGHDGLSPRVVADRRGTVVQVGPDGVPADAVTERLGVRSLLAVPLGVRGRLLAVLALARRDGVAAYDEDDLALAEEIAGRAALALDNALLLADERATALRLGLLQRVTAELSAATTPVEVARAAAGHVRQLVGERSRVGVYELDGSQRALVALTLAGQPVAEAQWRRVPLHAPLAVTTAVAERRPLWLETLEDWPGRRPGLPEDQRRELADFGFSATVAIPLTVAGRVLGVVGIGFPGPRRFPEAERGMLLAVAEQCAQALDRARLYRAEQSIAETLQRSLLPAQLPVVERLALAAEYLPGAAGTSAGGDWYDVLELDGTRVAVAVGDVVGQGPSAAAVMGQLRSALSAALMQGCPPAAALELLDRFAARLPGALASTAACVVLDWGAGTLRWARAGHPPPLLLGPDGAVLLEDDGAGPVLGVPGRGPYRDATAPLVPGSTLLLYTDGLVERRGEHLDTGLGRLRTAAGRLAAADPASLTRELLAEVLAGTDQADDVAVIAARLLPPPLRERMPADPTRLSRARRAVTAWAAAAGLGEAPAEDLQLALGEALANAVEHAYPGERGECAWSVERAPDGSVAVCVEDFGVWRPPPEDKGHRGRGLELIQALAEDVQVGRRTGPDGAEGAGTVVRFRVPVPVPVVVVRRSPGVPPPPRDEPVRVEARADGSGTRVALVGDLDVVGSAAVREALRARVGDAPDGEVTVDLRDVGYLASAGVGLLLELRSDLQRLGTRVSFVVQPGSVPARVLAISGVPVDPVP
jgi:anti-anti-sigma factor